MSHYRNANEQIPVKSYSKEAARRRWKILAQALTRNTENVLDIISVRRFTSYDLVSSKLVIQNNEDANCRWYEYSTCIETIKYWVLIRHPIRKFKPIELIGFNNTGNICVWPSEEILAYYSLCNLNLFSGKSVLELGGGMTCLAGLMVTKYSSASFVKLTDGNATAIENVSHIIKKNGLDKIKSVSCSVLDWSNIHNVNRNFLNQYDIILCADCLFFDDVRLDLVETIWEYLKDTGVALVMAPYRGNTFERFAQEAESKGLICIIYRYYNDKVWNCYLNYNKNPNYDENLHYPMLMKISKMF